MWNEPTQERLSKIPKLYETENVPLQEKLIYLHFFIGGSDWFVAEYDDDLFFGFVVLNGDLQMAEWGYVSFPELKSIKVQGWLEIDCEFEEHFPVQKAKHIELIRKANGWKKDAIKKQSSIKEMTYEHGTN